MGDLWEEHKQILREHRKGRETVDETVKLLEALHALQSPTDQEILLEWLWSELHADFLEVKKGKPAHNTVFPVVIYAWAQFGNTALLAPNIFSLLTWDNPSDVEVWVKQVAPAFSYALQKYASRFSEPTLGLIKSYTAPHKSAEDAHLHGRLFEPNLADAVTRIDEIIERTGFEKFRRSLLGNISEKNSTADLKKLLAELGLNPEVAEAMKRANDYLEIPGTFEPKAAADLIRTSIDEIHREIVKALVHLTQAPFSGKDSDGDRRAYMRDQGFISVSEEEFFSAIYRLLSREGTHKLIAARETVLLMATTVAGYLRLLLRRLSDWGTRST